MHFVHMIEIMGQLSAFKIGGPTRYYTNHVDIYIVVIRKGPFRLQEDRSAKSDLEKHQRKSPMTTLFC